LDLLLAARVLVLPELLAGALLLLGLDVLVFVLVDLVVALLGHVLQGCCPVEEHRARRLE